MGKKLFFVLILGYSLLLAEQGGAQSINYNAALIPDSLKKYADAVIRDQQVNLTIRNPAYLDYQFHEAVTVLDRNGRDAGDMIVPYDKFWKINSISARIYDADGSLIGKYKSKDFQDISAVEDFSLYEDSRIKQLDPDPGTYPYTVEMDYTLNSNQTYDIPSWTPQADENIGVAQSDFRILAPKDFPLRYKTFNIQNQVVQTVSGSQVSLMWEVSGLMAWKAEPMSPSFRDDVPELIVAPVNFTYGGIPGTFTNWQQYGLWTYDHLLEGRDAISPGMNTRLQDLIKNAKTSLEKARDIYHYVQQKARYVSVQIGIGGLQPMDALDVDRLGYADCKGLVNYTMALMHAAGIAAYYTEVNAGTRQRGFLPGFASAGQGNHVILCLPFNGDTTWLECTSRDIPFGYIGDFTDDRNVLINTPQGGVIARTKAYLASGNTQIRTAWFTLDSSGNLSGRLVTAFRGIDLDKRYGIDQMDESDRADRLQSIYPFNNLDILSYRLEINQGSNPVVREYIRLNSERYGTLDDHRMFFPVNQINRIRNKDIPAWVSNRKNRVVVHHGYTDLDSIYFRIPQGYQVEAQPNDTLLSNAYGTYRIQLTDNPGIILYTRSLSMNQGEFAPKTYQALLDFLQNLKELDTQPIVLKKTGS